MAGFERRRRADVDSHLTYRGRGFISGALFDLGDHPAAVAAAEGRIWGEVYELENAKTVLTTLDAIEGYRHDDPDRSLYTRARADVTLADGSSRSAWVYFYNAPLGAAPPIPSGDYRSHLRSK
jgi:gamma-glutamylcyclotransferase (GGCT)/AIG2-like uncharacterized protein YtfP